MQRCTPSFGSPVVVVVVVAVGMGAGCGGAGISSDPRASHLRINEVMPANAASCVDGAGEADVRSVEDVDPRLREGVDLILDAGELPGTPSTVVDLSAWEEGGTVELVREGALPLDAVLACLQ